MLLRSILLFALATPLAGFAQTDAAGESAPCFEMHCVVAKRGTAVVTVADMVAKVKTLDPKMQDALLSDPKQIGKAIENMLIQRQLANEVDALAAQKDLVLQARLKQAYDQISASYRLDQLIAEKITSDFEALARESYLTNLDAMKRPREVAVRHLLVSFKKHGEDAAKAQAEALKKQLSGADQERFQTLVLEQSEDPSKVQNAGLFNLNEATKGIDPEFLKGALALTKVGEISEPVRTEFGYHLLQLVEDTPAKVVPFEEAKSAIIAKLKNDAEMRLVTEYRSDLTNSGKLEFNPKNLEKVILGEDDMAPN